MELNFAERIITARNAWGERRNAGQEYCILRRWEPRTVTVLPAISGLRFARQIFPSTANSQSPPGSAKLPLLGRDRPFKSIPLFLAGNLTFAIMLSEAILRNKSNFAGEKTYSFSLILKCFSDTHIEQVKFILVLIGKRVNKAIQGFSSIKSAISVWPQGKSSLSVCNHAIGHWPIILSSDWSILTLLRLACTV